MELKTNYSDVQFKNDGRLKLLIIVGTRPEIIRLAAVINKCRKYFDCILAHTGQNILQLLPVNDTTVCGGNEDSYPYNCVSVYALNPIYMDMSALPSLGCDKSNLDKCLAAIDKEIAKLQNEPLSDRKLKAAKKQLLGQLAVSGDNGETQCLSMGKSLLSFGKIADSAENKAMVDSITDEDVRLMACEIFASDRMSQLIYV